MNFHITLRLAFDSQYRSQPYNRTFPIKRVSAWTAYTSSFANNCWEYKLNNNKVPKTSTKPVLLQTYFIVNSYSSGLDVTYVQQLHIYKIVFEKKYSHIANTKTVGKLSKITINVQKSLLQIIYPSSSWPLQMATIAEFYNLNYCYLQFHCTT